MPDESLLVRRKIGVKRSYDRREYAADASIRMIGDRDTVTSWSGCAGGRTVVFQAVAGLGHAWSGSSDAPGTLNPGCVLVRMLSDGTGATDAIDECAAALPTAGDGATESS